MTFVQPYFEEAELEKGVGYFERNNNLKKFYYETAYRPKEDGSALNQADTETNSELQQHQDLLQLCKRKTVLESNFFTVVVFFS